MKIAVTAASGHLGSEVFRTLTTLTDTVIGLARTPQKARSLGVEVRPGDYDQPNQLIASLAGIDTVLLIPGKDAPEARVQQHRNVIEAAKSAGVTKIVYASIPGPDAGTAFSPIVQSNRQTEEDIRASGLDWMVGRNGIYFEPDVEYIDSYRAKGEIANSAGDGKCGYTTRSELAHSYARLLTRSAHDSRSVDLNGTPISQSQLADRLNSAFGAELTYREMTSEEFVADRTAELGAFFGQIIGGIYDGIRLGGYDTPGDFKAVSGKPHQSWSDYFRLVAP